ncbi:diacylglycerol acyltransferase-domain-containing protein [Suillus subalutaceus]|uniref:diacylglycerol acyltransferase-domain-containing protein n=1 Tax=Suillus subalutaceus TaxID=48586 RepID=UPI001B885EBC|nr:diacylglycerol acyltransferase-domain-containing protein [Suillus subalutaceus]KAG1863551.1 diacylglycerol acyltransferase-domain-containing protein [Suillus subalutaceus]
MDKGHDMTALSRTISASSLRGRLTKLTGAPLRPVAALHASINFVPTKIPRKRRLQMMVVAVWSVLLVMSCFVFLMLCSVPALWPFLVMYLIWIFCIDKSPAYGNRLTPWFRSLKIWQYFAEYYPASLLKECDLPADRPYVFGYHPHGSLVSLQGALATFATEGKSTGFSKAFPGIKPHLLTLTNNFNIPLYREVIMALGISSVSRESCSNILSSGPGQAITIVVGGAAESLSARPGTADLTLKRRLGFIKVAIQHGADLVPVFSFGENDIYNQMPNEKGTTIYALQKKFQNMFGFTLPLFHGRGLLNYNLGLMPYRRRIVSVIGRPIHVQRCEKPSLEEVERVQRMYIEELTRIWNSYKDEFAKTRLRELSIVD